MSQVPSTPNPASPSPDELEPQLGAGAFGELVTWAVDHLVPGDLDHRDAVIETAHSIDHGLGLGYQTGGLEFHHDGSGAVDLLVHCESRRTRFAPEITVADWFPRLVASTRDLQEPELDGQEPEPHPPVIFTPLHWLEFDQQATGLHLAGVWQALATHGDASTSQRLEAIAATLQAIGLDADAVATSERLAHYVDTIGLFRQLGIMSGRTGNLKVFRRVTDTPDPHGALTGFLRHDDLRGDLATAVESDPDRLSAALIAGVSPLDIGVNVDIDMTTDRFGDGVGLEFHLPATNAPDQDPTTTDAPVLERVLDVLGATIGLTPQAIEEITAIDSRLPAAARWTRSFGGLDPLVHPGLRHRIFMATLNHLKVVLRAGQAPRIKSYVRLSVYQGTP